MRVFYLSCLMTVGAGLIGPARSGLASAGSWTPDMTVSTVAGVASAAAHVRATRCETSSCKAIVVVHELMDIAQYEIGDANGVTSLYLGDRPEVAGHRLRRTLLDHPDLFSSVCATAARLVSRVHPELGQIFVPVTLLVNSVDMDMRDHGHCAQTLVTALPRDPGNDQIRLNARRLCINGDENQHRSKTACAVLVQGVDEKAAVARGLEP